MAFKTADELGLPTEHHNALILTLGLLEQSTGRLLTKIVTEDGTTQVHFDMNYWGNFHPCGTVCCIGGAAEKIGKVDFTDILDSPKGHALNELFYPSGLDDQSEWHAITPKQAASVLRTYLEQAVVDWDHVIETNREAA